MELAPAKQILAQSAFWPLINTAELVADGNCGFHSVSHIAHGRESGRQWPEVHQRLLDHLNSSPAGYLRDVAIASGAGISLQSL